MVRRVPVRTRMSAVCAGAALMLAALAAIPARAEDAVTEERTFHSSVLDKTATVRVLLPEGYSPSDQRHPVLYFLHGGAGERFVDMPNLVGMLRDQLDAYGIVGVMPQQGSPWVDPVSRPSKQVRWEFPNQLPEGLPQLPDVGPEVNRGSATIPGTNAALSLPYETFVLTELIPFIESNYAVSRDRSGRGVLGHSGGAYGSFMLASRHPDLFAFVAGSSGPLSTRHPSCIPICGPVMTALGARDQVSDEVVWRAYDPYELAVNLVDAPITVVHSTGCPQPMVETPYAFVDPSCNLDGLAHPNNDDYEQRLQDLGIPHTYYLSPAPGHVANSHAPDYQEAFLPLAAATFENPQPDPARWSYKTTDPAFALWGYRFEVDRPNIEFLTLTDVDADGMVASGTGSLSVESPPTYVHGARYRITRTGADGTGSTLAVNAGVDGRLRFAVVLGAPRLDDESEALRSAGLFPFEDVRVDIEPDASAGTDPSPDCGSVWLHPIVVC